MPTTLPDTLAHNVRAALSDVLEALLSLYGDRLHRIVLLGSQARGEARAESDVDLLVVLEEPVDYMAEVYRMLTLKMDMLNRHDVLFSFKPTAYPADLSRQHPLMMNVRQEGAVLV